MVAVTTFYIDDSGTRHPDHESKLAEHKHDWFALGGILIDDEDIQDTEDLIDAFRARWPQMGVAPLHSSEIRGCHNNFTWLGENENTRHAFLTDLEALLLALPVIVLGCVIDRPGYNARYREKYGRQRWALCKTSFAVAVERATKYALQRDRKLRIYVERTDKIEDGKIKGYYNALRSDGHWFNPVTADKYRPVTPDEYTRTLYEFKTKKKTSRLIQMADLLLWPICMGGYEGQNNRPYARLVAAGKLIDCIIEPGEIGTLGIKYSCFDTKVS